MATTSANPRPSWDVHDPHCAAGQTFVKHARKIYHSVGIYKGYNFPLFIIGVGGLMGFNASRMFYFDFNGIFFRNSIPGEYYYYRAGSYRVGIIIHLLGAILGGFLASFQFIPIIRHKFMLFHRLNGYAASLLFLMGNAGAFMIMNVALGGLPSVTIWTGIIGAMITLGLLLAIWNIKRLQIDQHRAWMLRVWTWAGSIASLRLLQLAARHVTDVYGYTWYASIKCAQIYYMYSAVGVPDQRNPTGQLYPQCTFVPDATGLPSNQTINPAINTAAYVSVSSAGSGPEASAAFFRNIFPMAAWLALFLHALAIEVYLWLTPAEGYRLRNVSYERQVEKGLRIRGSFKDAGLTGTRIGDAPHWWSVPTQDYDEQKRLMNLDGAAATERKAVPHEDSESDSAGTMTAQAQPHH